MSDGLVRENAPNHEVAADGVRLTTSAIVGLGANLGTRERNIEDALKKLDDGAQISIVTKSTLRETVPVGGPQQGLYLNCVVEVRTSLTAPELLSACQRIEAALGRVRLEKDGPRTIDLDILLFGDLQCSDVDLKIPHPRMLERAFVLEPLAEIAPRRVHPVTGKSIAEHWSMLRAGAT